MVRIRNSVRIPEPKDPDYDPLKKRSGSPTRLFLTNKAKLEPECVVLSIILNITKKGIKKILFVIRKITLFQGLRL